MLFPLHPLLPAARLKFSRRTHAFGHCSVCPERHEPCVPSRPRYLRLEALVLTHHFCPRRLSSILPACIKNSLVPLCLWLSLRHPHRIPPLGTLNLLRNPPLLF